MTNIKWQHGGLITRMGPLNSTISTLIRASIISSGIPMREWCLKKCTRILCEMIGLTSWIQSVLFCHSVHHGSEICMGVTNHSMKDGQKKIGESWERHSVHESVHWCSLVTSEQRELRRSARQERSLRGGPFGCHVWKATVGL